MKGEPVMAWMVALFLKMGTQGRGCEEGEMKSSILDGVKD